MKLKMVTGIGAVPSSVPTTGNVINNNTNNNVTTTQQNPPADPVKRPSDNRRSNKPIMEKRRRARINNCLNELKTLILDAMKKDPARHSKLEKADILEMTVKHLENLQRQQAAMSQAADPNVLNKFKAGFTECANEVGRFPGLEPVLKRRLLQHLSNCINGVKTESQLPIQTQQQNTVQVHILPSPPSSPEQDQTHNMQQQQQQQQQQQHQTTVSQITTTSNGYFLTNGTGTSVQLIPTKLSNGNIAFVLPQSIQQTAPLPMLIPIPSRTSSTASAASSTSSNYDRISRENLSSPCYAPSSPSNSYEPMDCQPTLTIPVTHHHHHNHHQQQQQQQQQQIQQQQQTPVQRPYSSEPLSLVIKKTYNTPQVCEDEKPWRPW